MHGLKLRYGFEYVRQSGRLSQTQHMNICCLELPSTPWVFLLHDDDEVAAGSRAGFLVFAEHEDAGTAVAESNTSITRVAPRSAGCPSTADALKEKALRAVGLDRGKPPGVFFNVAAARAVGGFREICTISADYVLTCSLAFKNGAAFYSKPVGRYRTGAQQATDTSTPEKNLDWLDFCCRQAQAVVELGCSAETTTKSKTTSLGGPFGKLPPLVFIKSRSCKPGGAALPNHSPKCGPWQTHVRDAYPFLFLRPSWLGSGLRTITRRLRSYAGKAA